MATIERYIERKKIPIKTHTVQDIQGVSAIPTDVPFIMAAFDTFSFVTRRKEADEASDMYPRPIRTGPDHFRSDEIRFSEHGSVWFRDNNEILFSTITQKAASLDSPLVVRNEALPFKFMVLGLQDSSVAKRTLMVSELLRSNGIEAEMYLRILEPLELPLEGEMVSRDEFKRRLLISIAEGKNGEKAKHAAKPEDLPSIIKMFQESTFYIPIRAQQVPERLTDIQFCETMEDLQRVLKNAFAYVNYQEAYKASKDQHYQPEYFDIENPDDIQRYLMYYLPKRIAQNYGKLHNLGLVHVHPTLHNISTVGSVYDLDSVQGDIDGLSDESPTIDKLNRDLHTITKPEKDHYAGLYGLLMILKKRKLLKFDEIDFQIVQVAFNTRYADQRLQTDNLIPALGHTYWLTKQKLEYNFPALEALARNVMQSVLWEYENPQLVVELMQSFIDSVEKEIELALAKRDPMDIFSIAMTPELPTYVSEYKMAVHEIKNDIQTRHADKLAKIKEEHGDEAADAVADLFALYELQSVYEYDLPKEVKRKVIRYRNFKSYAQMLPHSTPLKGLEALDRHYQHFDDPETELIHEYFMMKLEEQLGITFREERPIDELISLWENEEDYALIEIGKALSLQVTNDEDFNVLLPEVITGILGDDNNPMARFKEWLSNMISQNVYQEHRDIFRKIRKRHKANTKNIALSWYGMKEARRIERNLYKEQKQDICQRRQAALYARYPQLENKE